MASKHLAILTDLSAERTIKKRKKSNHTVYLDTDNYLLLKAFCKEHQLTPSEVIDRLLKDFVEDALAEGTITYKPDPKPAS